MSVACVRDVSLVCQNKGLYRLEIPFGPLCIKTGLGAA